MDNEIVEHKFKFEDMDLRHEILRGIYSHGFETPSEIQSKSITLIASGRDIVAQSQSGTGKTGAFVIGVLQRVNENVEGCQAIILAPTRELAIQIHDVFQCLGQYAKITPVLCIGRYDIQQSKNELEKGSVVAIGTPGRIIDMIDRKYISMRHMKTLVLDEADEMLSDGYYNQSSSFQNQIKTIVQRLPREAQICLFSATMPIKVLELTDKFLHDPLRILVKKEELTLEGIKQFYIDVEKEQYKFEVFCDLYRTICLGQSMVYVSTKKRAEWLKKQLESNSYTVSMIHSDMSTTERVDVMKDFRTGATRILVSTDLLSRGIDVQQVSLVINYDLPRTRECYLHRIGRSGRFGRKGVAINFTTTRDYWVLRDIQKFYSTQIEPMPANIQDLI